jgi:hypothetical protein
MEKQMRVDIDYGFSCGRHWIKINGKVIAQTPGDDVWMRDEDVCDLARAIVPGCVWEKASRLNDGMRPPPAVDLKSDRMTPVSGEANGK